MDLFTTARRLESKIAGRFDTAAQRTLGSPARDPLAVIQAVVEAIDGHVQPIGRGRRVFPYNAATVTLAAVSPADRVRFEAVLEHAPSLRERIVERVRAAGAELDALDVTVVYAAAPQADWIAADFHLELARHQRPVEILTADPAPHPVGLTVELGTAEQTSYALAQARIDLGRGRDVRDTRNQLLRTNHVAFTEGADDAANSSVSRRHAHISWEPAARAYRVFDDGSAQGTHVLRDGLAIAVRTGARGLRLRNGDEIVLGEARVRVVLGEGRPHPRSGTDAGR